MEKSAIQSIIFSAINMANHARVDDAQIPVGDDTQLYGENGHLESMSLVAFLIDIEEAMLDEGIQITLSDEKAMSQSRSPFRNVKSLTDYIYTLIQDAKSE